MNHPQALDKLDKAILRALQQNGRETYDVIGEQVGLSPSAVLRRAKRLKVRVSYAGDGSHLGATATRAVTVRR